MIGERLAIPTRVALPARRSGTRARPLFEPLLPQIRDVIRQGPVLTRLMLSMVLVSITGLIYLNQASHESVLEFNIAALQQQQVQLTIDRSNLYAQASELQNPAHIENLAITQLHMTRINGSNMVWVRPVFPSLRLVTTDGVDQAARHDSQPLAWLEHAATVLRAQL